MSDDDRRRIVACWALERAQVQAVESVKAGQAVPEGTDAAEVIREWAAWYAEQAYRLGLFVADHEAEWTKPLHAPAADYPEAKPDPEPAESSGGGTWGTPQGQPSGDWGPPGDEPPPDDPEGGF